MFNAHTFFKRRLGEHLKETSRYLRYIFNGHIAVAMFFFISALAYYYQQWLAELPENFPVAFLVAVVFGGVASYSPVQTLLKEPDLVFLIAAEKKMGAYFRNAIMYSFIVQLYILLLAAAALGPLYFAGFAERSGRAYLLTIIVLLIFKIWNLLTNWWMLKIQDGRTRRIDGLVRFILNIAIFYFLIEGHMLLAAIITLMFMGIFLYDRHISNRQAGLAWELLVEKDRNRMQAFYRLANMFTDVPHLKNPVKKRHWLVNLVNRVPFEKRFTYDYLYRITFVRSGDYFGMYVRLLIIGGLFIFFVPSDWMKLAFAVLFLYMSIFQMMALFQHHRTIMWIDIYPVDTSIRQKALLKWLMQLAVIQTIIYVIILLLGMYMIAAAMVLVAGLLFSYIFIQGYGKRRLVS